jgi:formate dehydrogenase subunit delta
MQIDSLIRMANQIGGFFNSYSDRQLARSEVASHMQKFWEPRMRLAILQYNEKHRTLNNDLLPLVREALKIMPPPEVTGVRTVDAARAHS